MDIGEHPASINGKVWIFTNADSVKMGKKDIIKIDKVININMDALGYLDPGVTVNIIKDNNLLFTDCDKTRTSKVIPLGFYQTYQYLDLTEFPSASVRLHVLP